MTTTHELLGLVVNTQLQLTVMIDDLRYVIVTTG